LSISRNNFPFPAVSLSFPTHSQRLSISRLHWRKQKNHCQHPKVMEIQQPYHQFYRLPAQLSSLPWLWHVHHHQHSQLPPSQKMLTTQPHHQGGQQAMSYNHQEWFYLWLTHCLPATEPMFLGPTHQVLWGWPPSLQVRLILTIFARVLIALWRRESSEVHPPRFHWRGQQANFEPACAHRTQWLIKDTMLAPSGLMRPLFRGWIVCGFCW